MSSSSMTARQPETSSLDALFRDAVSAIDAGDVAVLERMLRANPALVRERLESPGAWLRDRVGKAVDGFFQRPYLLWFVAEDPVRNGKLPANIAEVASVVIAAARRENAATLQEQLDYALALVSWSWIARESGVQIPLIDVLADAGAKLDGNPENALVNGNFAAAEHLVRRGARLTLAAAMCLRWWDDADRLLPMASDAQKQFALVLAALHGNTEALRRLIAARANVNARSESLYAHATPLHHAVSSGSLEAVRVLVDAGADPTATDTVWSSTPLGWAEHAVSEEQRKGPLSRRRAEYGEIVAYLRAETERRTH